MLRASSKAVGQPVDAAAAAGGASEGPPHGPLLVAFVDATTDDPSSAEAERARLALAEGAGPAALADAAAVLANFEMMTRVADGTGARQLPQRLQALTDERARLGLDDFASAR